jgi:anthranilate synthase component 1
MPNLVPIIRELPADLETPVSVYLKLKGRGPSFLLESITGGEQVARYSFIGVDPGSAYVCRGNQIERRTTGNGKAETSRLGPGQDLLHHLAEELAKYEVIETAGLPRFSGGLVGYLGYDVVRFFEPKLQIAAHPDLPDAIFLLADRQRSRVLSPSASRIHPQTAVRISHPT